MSFWKQFEAMPGWCRRDKAELIQGVLANIPQAQCVEIGVFGGRSLVAAGEALRHTHGTIWGVDPWCAEAACEGDVGKENVNYWSSLDYEIVYRQFIQAVLSLGLQKEVRWLRMNDTEAIRLFDDNSLDFVHLDGNHSEEVSTRNTRDWLPKVKVGGYLLMDDTQWDTQKVAVEFLKERMELKHDHVGKHGDSWMLFQRRE